MKMAARTSTVVLASLSVVACDTVTPASPDPIVTINEHALPSVSYGAIRRDVMDSRMSQLTREMAIALNNPILRKTVHDAMLASGFPENKLHLKAFLESAGDNLLAGMAVARGNGAIRSQVLRTLDSLVDLEFYMPVPAHKQAWDGGPNLIVASALEDDGRIPVAFDLRGNPVELLSADEAPNIPTLAIVPVETDFSRDPIVAATSASSATVSSTPGVYMTSANILDDHEGFLHGSPEFEVHVWSAPANDPENFAHRQCSGEKQNPPYKYDHDSGVWTGEVRLATAAELAGADTSTVRFVMYEDDEGPCTFNGGRPPNLTGISYTKLIKYIGTAVAVEKWINPPPGQSTLKRIGEAVLIGVAAYENGTTIQKDDFVGHIESGCFTKATGSVTRYVRDSTNLAIKGAVGIDWRDLGDRPLCAPGFEINGPTELEENENGTWTIAHASGGGTPIAYQWYLDDVIQSGETGTSFTASFGAAGDHYIKVRTTPTGYPVAYQSHYVWVPDAGCPPGEEICQP